MTYGARFAHSHRSQDQAKTQEREAEDDAGAIRNARSSETLRDRAPKLRRAIATLSSGADQAGVRLYNERLLLSLVRRFGQLSKIEVARLTGLSVQSSSAIMNRLQAEGLLKREAPLRGRVGQPTVPVSLDPDGAYSLGPEDRPAQLRSRADRFLRTHPQPRQARAFAYPTPEHRARFRQDALPQSDGEPHARSRRAQHRRAWHRLAVPALELGERKSARRAGAMEGWRDFRSPTRSAASAPIPSRSATTRLRPAPRNSFFGEAWRERDFLYFFIGFFLGGGLVLDGALYMGRTGNAGALGSMPITRARRRRAPRN